MATGARTPREDPVSAEVRAVMLEGLVNGLDFEDAWARVDAQVTFPPDWRNPAPGEESIVDFTRRHYFAVWHGHEAGRPCEADGCPVLLDPGERWCLLHLPEVLVLESSYAKAAA